MHPQDDQFHDHDHIPEFAIFISQLEAATCIFSRHVSCGWGHWGVIRAQVATVCFQEWRLMWQDHSNLIFINSREGYYQHSKSISNLLQNLNRFHKPSLPGLIRATVSGCFSSNALGHGELLSFPFMCDVFVTELRPKVKMKMKKCVAFLRLCLFIASGW